MAHGKKGFMLYADQKELFTQLPDDKAGQLIKMIYSYVNDEDPISDDLLLNIAFTPIKQQLKRDLKKWEERSERSRINGLKGGRPKEAKKPTGLSGLLKEPKKPDKDNVNDNDNVTVKDNVKVKYLGLFKNVKLSDENIKTLTKEFGEKKLKSILDKLSSYKKATGKNYKSDIGAIRQWVIDAVEKDSPKEELIKY